ncbi:portal protein [Vibrio phage vB_ValP_IME234]|nr:portal protein [Vibrio phage vB_ValP_IME234]BBI55057.1 phage portal (connector) protein [Vibrio phage KIT05]
MPKQEELKVMEKDKQIHYLRKYIRDARDYQDEKLQENWKQAQRYYYGEKMGNEVEGRSQVISRDVSDAIDWMMPDLMEIFATDYNAVQYEARTPAHVDGAEHMSNYANYTFFNLNEGFMIMHQWFKDALMFKRGIVKHYWTEETNQTAEYYTGLSNDGVTAVLAKDGAELLEIAENEDGTFDIKISVEETKRYIKVEPVPPEEFLIDRNAKCVKDATFVGHQRKVTKADLYEMGYTAEQIEELNNYDEDDPSDSELRLIREMYNGAQTHDYDDYGNDPMNDKYWIIEAYVRMDVDGDGFNELRRIIMCGNTILSDDDWDFVPFSSLTPNPIQHQFYGQSIYDMVHDVQEVKTALLRNQLDNMYLINNGRYAAVEGQVNLADMQNNKLGGVVREKMQGALRPLVQPELPKGTYDMVAYYDEIKTNRTGVSPRTQGLDDKVLNSHTGSGQVNRVMSTAEKRLKLVARIFAETGVRDLFIAIKQLAMKHQDEQMSFRLNGKYVTIDPATWRDQVDMKVLVGNGTKDKDQQLMHLMRMFELTQSIVGNGGLGILTNEQKIYNLLTKITENAGYTDVEEFWLDPTTEEALAAKKARAEEAAKPTPDEIKANADAMKKQSDSQVDQLKVQQEAKKNDVESRIKLKELELREREIALQEREQALQEDIQDMEREKFEWAKQVNIAEVVLTKETEKAVSIGDGKLYKGRNKGQTDSGNTGQ